MANGNQALLYPAEVQEDLNRLQRRRNLAGALTRQSMQPIQGQRVGRVYAPPHWAQGLAQIANALAGQYVNQQADVEQKRVIGDFQNDQRQAVREYLENQRFDPDKVGPSGMTQGFMVDLTPQEKRAKMIEAMTNQQYPQLRQMGMLDWQAQQQAAQRAFEMQKHLIPTGSATLKANQPDWQVVEIKNPDGSTTQRVMDMNAPGNPANLMGPAIGDSPAISPLEQKKLDQAKDIAEANRLLREANSSMMISPDGNFVRNTDYIEAQKEMRAAGKTDVSTTVNVGEKLSPGQKKMDEKFAETFLQWEMGGQRGDAFKGLSQLREVSGQLGPESGLTGKKFSVIPEGARSVMTPEAQNASELVSEVVQRNLRVILGAQFTEKEGERLIARAYNIELPPELNQKRLNRLIISMEDAVKAKEDAAAYFRENETLKGWKGKLFTMSDFDAALDDTSAIDALPSGAQKIGEEGGKAVYRLPDGSRMIED